MTLLTSDQDTFEQPQDDEVVLSVKNVSKRFCRDLKRSLFYGIKDIASEVFGARRTDVELRKGEFWALNDVSFELRRGEALGLVGANGAGKTTLLRIISGLIKPDHGSVEIKGRVAPLIALGAGFNPILTGRENIYVNMSILGLSKKEIDERFDQVVEFAEIGEAIDAPVQSYSSGMAARLGFACAIHTKPDILLIDEVLAVGDIKFRVKCYRKLIQIRKKGVSFILVSHNPHSILGLCDLGVYLHLGNFIASGKSDQIMAKYEKDLFKVDAEQAKGIILLPPKDINESYGLDIIAICLKDSQGNLIDALKSGEPGSICLKIKAYKNYECVITDLIIHEKFGEGDSTLRLSNFPDETKLNIYSGEQDIEFKMHYCGLRPNCYTMKVSISQDYSYNILDAVESFTFAVESDRNMNQSLFHQPGSWIVSEVSAII